MEILQGKYLKRVESAKGTLKSIRLKTEAGKQTVEIPKALRAIAQAELAVGDEVRVWVTWPDKANPKKARNTASKGGKSIVRQKSARQKPIAQQIIPLSPKAKVMAPAVVGRKVAAKKKQTARKLTVQLCQKKNCCKKGGDKLWVAFEAAAQAANASTEKRDFKLEAVGCLGGCKNGPNVRLLPENVKHRNVKPSDIEALIGRTD